MNELEEFNQFKQQKLREANRYKQEADQYKQKLEQAQWEEKLSQFARSSFSDNDKKKLASDLLKARVPKNSSLEKIDLELDKIQTELGDKNNKNPEAVARSEEKKKSGKPQYTKKQARLGKAPIDKIRKGEAEIID